MKQYLSLFFNFLIQHRLAIFLWLLVAFVLLTNTFHEKYPDEFDNILGGQYLSEGQMLYRDYFTHHGPVPYLLAALLMPFSFGSFVAFRVAYALFLFIYFLLTFKFLQKYLSVEFQKIYILLILALSISATYFWGHMLLADSFAALMLLPAYLLFFTNTYSGQALTLRHHIFISLLLAAVLLSSMTFLFLVLTLYCSLFFAQRKSLSGLLKLALIYASPYLLLLLILLVTGSLPDWYRQTIQFNAQFYIYNYPRASDSTFINPLRYAVVIAHNFFVNIHPVLTNLLRVDLYYPFNTSLAYGNLLLLSILLYQRKYLLAFTALAILAFANARSNPLTSEERDYQAAMYITISYIHSFLGLYLGVKTLNTLQNYAPRLLLSVLLIPVFVLWFFNTLFITRKWSDRVYDRYMGLTPLIYDRPALAPIINATIKPKEYMWIGPFDFEDQFYARGLSPSKYHILLPGMAKNGMVQELQADLEINKPKLIIFDWHLFILGNAPKDYAPQFLDYLTQNYIRLLDYQEPDGSSYKSVAPIELRRDVEAKMYINPNYKDEVIADLLRANIIYQAN